MGNRRRNRADLLAGLGAESFLVRDAVARGFTPRQMRHSALSAPYSGVRSLASSGDSLVERALQYLPRLREGERFSHATALALLGCAIYVEPDAPIDVESQPGTTPVRARGVLGHRAARASPPFLLSVPETDQPVPVAPPESALLQGCATLPFTEAVVAIDALIRETDARFDPNAAARLEDVHAMLDASSGRRGAARLRSALGLARVGAESRMETLTRLAGERVGVTGLTLQLVVVDRDGRRIGRFDLADERSRVLFEYDGEQHRTSRRQYLRDLDRLERARDAGWRIRLFHAEEVLAHPDRAGRRMLLATGRPPRPVPVRIRRLLDEWPSPLAVSALPRKTL